MDSSLNPSCAPTQLLLGRPGHSPGPNLLLFFQLPLKHDFLFFFYTSARCVARNQSGSTSRGDLWRRLAKASSGLTADHITATSILRSIMKATQLLLYSSRGCCIFNLIESGSWQGDGGAGHERRLETEKHRHLKMTVGSGKCRRRAREKKKTRYSSLLATTQKQLFTTIPKLTASDFNLCNKPSSAGGESWRQTTAGGDYFKSSLNRSATVFISIYLFPGQICKISHQSRFAALKREKIGRLAHRFHFHSLL